MDTTDETRKVAGPKTSHKFLMSFEPITTFDGDDDVDDETMIKCHTIRKEEKIKPCIECSKMAEMQIELDLLRERLNNFIKNTPVEYASRSKEALEKRLDDFSVNHPGLVNLSSDSLEDDDVFDLLPTH